MDIKLKYYIFFLINSIILSMRRKQIKNENFFVYSKNLLKINLIYLYFIHIFIYINVYF